MKTLLVILLALAARSAYAQEVNVAAVHDSDNIVSVKTGAEYGFMAAVGYARVQNVVDRPVVLGGELALNWGGLDIHDYRIATGARVPVIGTGHWRVLGGLGASLRGTDDDLAQMTTIGGDISLVGGRYAPGWFVAAEAGLDVALATHLTPSAVYTMDVYPDAKAGWYAAPGAMIRAGLQGGFTVARYDVILRAGRLLDTKGQPATFPIYATLAVARRW